MRVIDESFISSVFVLFLCCAVEADDDDDDQSNVKMCFPPHPMYGRKKSLFRFFLPPSRGSDFTLFPVRDFS